MSDPLSVTAGVAGILSFGIQVCNGVTQYYEHWKSYDEDVKTTYEMIGQLSGTFNLVNRKVESSLLKRRPAVSQVLTSIKLCENGILALEKRLQKIKATEPNLGTTKRDVAVGELKKQGKRLLYPFKQGTLGKLKDVVGELRDNLAPALTLLGLDVGEEALVELRAVRAENQAWRSEERAQQVLNWLSPLEFGSRQQEILGKRCGKTAGWILEDERFVQWSESADAPKGLWCQGKMGSGKSVTTSVVIDHLQTKHAERVAYLYCDWQDSEAQNIEHLTGSLLKQIVGASSDMPPIIDEAFAQHKKGKTPLTLSESIDLLRNICMLVGETYIAIDALDECNFGRGFESSKMVQLENILVDLLDHSSCDLRIFITSRFGPSITAKSLVKEVEIRAMAMDLKEFVMSSLKTKDLGSPWASPELESKIQNDPQLLQQICEECMAQSDEMFLLLKLHITHLKRQVNMRQFRNALKELPSNLNASIDTSLKRLQSQPPHLREIGTRVLVWVAYAKRPLTISELQHALAVEVDDEEFFEDGISPEHVLTASCAGLVALDPNTKVVRFINMSIREYLSQMDIPLQLDPELYILRICTRYLRFCEYEILPIELGPDDTTNTVGIQNQKIMDDRFTAFPLLRYAAKYWAAYAKDGFESKALETIVDLIWDKQRANFLFAAFYAASSYSLESCPSWVTGFHLAAFFGLPLALSTLFRRMEKEEGVERHSILDQGDSSSRTPLLLAVSRGNTDIVQMLLMNKANVTGRARMASHWQETSKWWYPTWARDDYSVEALEVAAEEGHKDIVTLLLAHGAKLGGDTGVYGGALEAAVFKGHEEIVHLLLEAGARIQVTVLQSAVYAGNIKIMRYLLTSLLEQARKADKEAGLGDESDTAVMTDHPYPNENELWSRKRIQLALYAASLAGRISIAKLLFEYGADVNAETKGFHCTALAAACAHGHDKMVLMLLEEGADVNHILPEQKEPDRMTPRSRWRLRQSGSKSGRHGTALQAASYAGNATSVELLLFRGADPNTVAGYYGTALQAAAFGGDLKVVETLLQHGAEVNTSLGVYGNPLQAALLNGSEVIVQKLLESGADVNAEGGRWAFPIIAAARTGIVSNLKMLINANANLNATSKSIGTALYAAVTTQPVLEAWKTPAPPFNREPLTTEFDDFISFAQKTRAVGAQQAPHIFGNFLTFAAKEIFLDNDSLPQLSVVPDTQGLLDCAKVLLEAKADPNIKGGEYGTPLLGAVAIGNLKAVKLLTRAGADVSFQFLREEDASPRPNVKLWKDWSEYDSESRTEDEPEGRSGVESDDPPRMKDRKHRSSYYYFRHVEPRTPLAMATRDGNSGIARALIDAGANPNEESYLHGDTLLHHCGSEDVMQLLIEEGVAVEKSNRWGLTPLHVAAWKCSLSMVRTLLSCGGSVTSLTLDGRTPLHFVASADHWGWHDNEKSKEIDALLSAGANIDARTKYNHTPLCLTHQQDTETIMQLLKEDPSIVTRNKWLNIVISRSEWAKLSYLELIRWLLENGADANQGSDIESKLEPVPELVAQKLFGEPNLKTPEMGQESSHILFGTHDENSISEPVVGEDEVIIKTGARSFYRKFGDIGGSERLETCNPLLKLAGEGPDEPERLELLIKANIELSIFGKNALLLAVQRGNLQIARKLLYSGVNISRTDMEAAMYTALLHLYVGWSQKDSVTLGNLKKYFEIEIERKNWLELLEMAKA